jgi:hypothetical protein
MSFDEFETAIRSHCREWSKDSHEALLFYFTSVRGCFASHCPDAVWHFKHEPVCVCECDNAQAKRYGMPPMWSDDEAAIARHEVTAAHNITMRDAVLAVPTSALQHIEQLDTINLEELRYQITQQQAPTNQLGGHHKATARQQALRQQIRHCTERQVCAVLPLLRSKVLI